MAENGDDLSCPDDIIENARITLNLLSEGSYPLTKWLVTPYSISQQKQQQKKKNSKAFFLLRVTSECAFGILKARWRCFLNNLDSQIENISKVIIVDYIYNNGILEAVIRQERNARRRRRNHNHATVNAINTRKAIKIYAMNNY